MDFISFLLMIFPNPTKAAGADHLTHPSTRVSGSSGGPSCPSPTARFSWPLWPWWGFVTENRRVKVPSKPPVTVKGCSSQRRGTMSTHTYTRVHWACTQVGTFLERHPGVVMAPLRAKRQDVGTRVGPNTFCHNPQALIQVGVGSQWEGLPET